MADNDKTVAQTVAAAPSPKQSAARTARKVVPQATVAGTVAVTKAAETKTIAAKPPAKSAPKPATRTAAKSPETVSVPAPSKTVARKATPSKEPRKIGKYIKEKKLAQGGMGAVYIASDPELGNKVIIKKLLLKNNAAAEDRFKREANILRELQNPHIVNTYEYFKLNRSSYLVEELIEGCSLDSLIEKYKEYRANDIKDDASSTWKGTGPLGTELALLVFLDACYGLNFAHRKNIVHRDIKPGNLLISRDAEVKLTDFGIASDDKADPSEGDDDDDDDDPVDSEGLTVVGSMLGTPSYMSPEQVRDSSSVDRRADIYSMGVMLYEMLTGEKPFGCPVKFDARKKKYVEDEEVSRAIMKGRYSSPRKFNPSVPRKICSMIRKMLRYDAGKRYDSMEPIIRILAAHLSKFDKSKIRQELAVMVRGLSDNKKHKIQIYERRKPVAQMFAACVFGALVVIGGSMWLWRNGYVHKTLLSPWYTPVDLTMKIPDKGVDNVYSTNLPMMAFFFEDEGEQEEVGNSSRKFEKKGGTDGKSQIFTTRPVYLQKGRYRIKVVFGSYIIWRSVNVGKSGENIVIDDLVSMKDRRISITARAFDLKTGADLTQKTKFTLFYKGDWVSLQKVPPKDIVSGRAWKVRANCDGYSTKEFSMLIDWYQDSIILNAGLE